MGLVQSQSGETKDAIEVEGLLFTVQSNLKRLIPVYGNLVIDFKQSFLGDMFSVRFSQSSGSCAC